MTAPSAGAQHDLRAPALAAVGWLAALAALQLPGWVLGVAVVTGVLGLLYRRWRGRPWQALGLVLTLVAGMALSTGLHLRAVRANALPLLAAQQATVSARVVTTSDVRWSHGRYGAVALIRARTVDVVGRGFRHRVRAPVLLLGDRHLGGVALGSTIRVHGRLSPATGDTAALLSTRGPPKLVRAPGPLFRGTDRLRRSIRAVVEPQPVGPRALVPALVDGDDGRLPEEVAEDFRTSGLTHLLAVSGTNLTLVVGFLLILARWSGVRARGLAVVGAVGVAGFVLLARTEPSVVRAAAMGSVALLGLGSQGRHRGGRALGVAVLVLLLMDPWLAESIGFALSAVATAGILWFAPGWRDALQRWCPRWLAEAVSVPLAAQLACTPLIAAISGQVSLVAVAANLLAAPAVGPATVLGLLGGVVGLGNLWLGRLLATPAAWCAGWIVAVAERAAAVPVAAVSWPSGPVDLAVLSVVCVATALSLVAVLLRPWATAAVSCLLLVVVLVPLPTPGWPPEDWVLVACDVGQGDALVLPAGSGSAVVVDAGPDPRPVQRCLDRLGVRRVPVVVLTHFHADHVDGLAGVLSGRRVGAIEVTTVLDPPAGVRLVEAVARRAGVPVRAADYGEVRRIGALSWQVVAPSGPPPASTESAPNDASLVLLVHTHGVRLLLMGDEEQPSQQRLLAETGGIRADVLKVAHHGSASQDGDLIRATGARLALISVGADNDYGHPAPSLMALLRSAHLTVRRTDREGDIAVVAGDHGGLRVATRGRR